MFSRNIHHMALLRQWLFLSLTSLLTLIPAPAVRAQVFNSGSKKRFWDMTIVTFLRVVGCVAMILLMTGQAMSGSKSPINMVGTSSRLLNHGNCSKIVGVGWCWKDMLAVTD